MTHPKNIYDVLEREQHRLTQLIEKLQRCRRERERACLFEQVHGALSAHADAEEAVVHATLEEHDETRGAALRSRRDLERMRGLLEQLEATRPTGSAWQSKLDALRESFESHYREEEEDLFEAAQTVLAEEEAEELGRRFLRERIARLG